jgi:hypothetical protein
MSHDIPPYLVNLSYDYAEANIQCEAIVSMGRHPLWLCLFPGHLKNWLRSCKADQVLPCVRKSLGGNMG